jgi:hypothetical protein
VNHYRGNRLEAVEEAILQQEIERMNTGVFTSQTEIAAAVRSRAYHTSGPLGDLYRAALDAKAARTQEAGFSILGENKVSHLPTAAVQAGATRDADGNIVVGVLDVDNPDGAVRREKAADNDDSGKPRIEHKPGGVLSVSLNRSAIPLIDGTAAEKREREAYLKRAREHGERWPTIPLIPENKE